MKNDSDRKRKPGGVFQGSRFRDQPQLEWDDFQDDPEEFESYSGAEYSSTTHNLPASKTTISDDCIQPSKAALNALQIRLNHVNDALNRMKPLVDERESLQAAIAALKQLVSKR